MTDGYSAWISIDNVKLPQYGREVTTTAAGTKEVTCWIASEVGKGSSEPIFPLDYESDETTGPRMTVPACKANLVVFHHISYLNYESDETIGCGVTVRRREAYLTIFKQKHYTILIMDPMRRQSSASLPAHTRLIL
ncbi:hypothetical protein BD779DRAFT_1678237 [Infundibulicybe gibba]|nr:hypothetical protein BD779DRAFT_1678237 [Infundibulicybe gibba]